MSFSWSKFAQIAAAVGPVALAAAGVPPQITALVIHGIQVAEESTDGTDKTGAEKKAIAMDAVTTGLEAVNAAKPGSVDVAELTGVVSQGIDVTVSAIHAAKDIPTKSQSTVS